MPASRGYQTGKHLEAFILVILAQESMHGGAVLNRLKQLLPPVWTIDDGHVYRLLRNMESEGALQSDWVTEAAGAPVRLYRLTDAGRLRLADWKEEIETRVASLNVFLDLWSHSQ